MSEHEFTTEQNKVFSNLYKRMLLMAILVLVGGAYSIVFALTGSFQLLLIVSGILYVVMAITFYLPLDNFKKIISTEGQDITELMTALNEMDKGWFIVNVFSVLVLLTYVAYFFGLID